MLKSMIVNAGPTALMMTSSAALVGVMLYSTGRPQPVEFAAATDTQSTSDNSYLTVVSWPAHAWNEWDSAAKGPIGKCMSQDATTDEDGAGFLFASCCTSDGAGMSRNCGDAGPKTFAQAEAICTAQGGQLCTAKEAAVDLATASKGCQVDGPHRASGADMNRLWTETRCEQCYGTHEAEDATIIGGAVEHANVNSPGHAGFTGRSFVDYINPDGDYIEWYVSSCDEGPATAAFRYALASNNRPLQVLVNGQEVDSGLLDFGPTGSWSTWADVSVSVNLNAGSNVIRLVASGRSGANMDSLTLAPPVATPHSYVGCFVDDGSRDLQQGPRAYGHTSASCMEECSDYSYFALQNNGWCVCGNAYSSDVQYAQVDNNQCGANCAGDDQLCGAGWRNAVYSTGREPPIEFIGCYRDDGSRDLQEGPRQYGYTSESCKQTCSEYNYFALQNNGWCVCGNEYATEPQYSRVGNSQCGSVCAGENGLSPARYCGAGWRNAVYRV